MANSGFKVIDLGKDIAPEEIVEAVLREKADICGLAALMTTTMPQIDKTVAALHAKKSTAKVMIGGAAVTADYVEISGADCYAGDAVHAVRLAKEMLGID